MYIHVKEMEEFQSLLLHQFVENLESVRSQTIRVVDPILEAE